MLRAPGHRHVESNAAAYALGALDEAARSLAEDHLERCQLAHPQIMASLAATAILASLVSPLEPPPELWPMVLAAISAEASLRPSADQEPGPRRCHRRMK